MVGFVNGGSSEIFALELSAFRNGLIETGYNEGQNVVVGYHWIEGQYSRLPALMADFVRRQVAVIAMPAITATKASIMTAYAKFRRK